MDSLLVRGGNQLNGEIEISGAKNAALPIFAASILTDKELIFSNVPSTLTDIATMKKLLEELGVNVEISGKIAKVRADKVDNFTAPYDIVRKMRASIWVLGPLLARFGEAKVSFPGGCALGARQVDLHIAGLEAMGAEINIDRGYIIAKAPKGLNGADFVFNKVSVGATINVLLAATLANGTTRLKNCAFEPEIQDLCNFLTKAGAKIKGVGTRDLEIEGVTSLQSVQYQIIGDRIEAGTYMIAGAITGGELLLKNIPYDINQNTVQQLRKNGIEIENTNNGILIKSDGKIIPADISTEPFPGFATDLQAQYMALMCVADGTCVVTENLFENRFMHVPELCRMGADIKIHNSGHSAIIRGKKGLIGSEVMASDLRASVSLIIAALVAEGETKVNRIYHLDRGYELLEEKLSACGADVERIKS